MRILHLNTNQLGGAALCAIRICKALEQYGTDSRMLIAEGKTMPKGIKGSIAEKDDSIWFPYRAQKLLKRIFARIPLPVYKEKEKLQYLIQKLNQNNLYLHQPLSDYTNIAHHPLVKWADIIHLHWVSDFVDYQSFFKNIKKPIIWTLHDKYPAVGVQHYCSEFYPIPNNLKRIDSYCRKIKRNGVLKAHNLYLVAISDMMIGICRESDVLEGFPVTLIHNGVDTDIFHPYDKYDAREELGLIANAKIFLFSGYSIQDQNKGLYRMIEALEKTESPNKLLVCIGNVPFNSPIPETSFPVILTGMINNQEKLAKYYAAADFFIQNSYEETFAQTPLEAMSCGTPVISTPCSGAKDLIRPFNGVVCNGYDSISLSEGIMMALAKKYDSYHIRNYILENYDYRIIAKQYIKLYKSVIKKQNQSDH